MQWFWHLTQGLVQPSADLREWREDTVVPEALTASIFSICPCLLMMLMWPTGQYCSVSLLKETWRLIDVYCLYPVDATLCAIFSKAWCHIHALKWLFDNFSIINTIKHQQFKRSIHWLIFQVKIPSLPWIQLFQSYCALNSSVLNSPTK